VSGYVLLRLDPELHAMLVAKAAQRRPKNSLNREIAYRLERSVIGEMADRFATDDDAFNRLVEIMQRAAEVKKQIIASERKREDK
jgi:hypothetical protein